MSSFHKSLTFSRPFLSLSLTFAVVTFGPSNLRSAALQSNLVEEKKALATDLTPSNGGSAELQGNARNGYGKLEMSFEANHGQTDATVDFLARGAGYTLFLTSAQAVFVMAYSTTGETPSILRMKLGGGSTQSVAEGLNRLPGIVNYFLGDDSEKWHANIPTFARVLYPGVYEGVDLVYYGNQSQLEYDFVVNPGTDYKKIELRFEGADKVEIDSGTGDLLLRLGENTLRQQKPIVYQEINGQRKQIESRYELKGAGGIGFAVSEYNSQLPLVIDPVLVYSTYLGGSGADAGNQIAVDAAGSAYITGETESANFPTVDPFQTIHAQKDAFVTKFNSTGSAVIYSTYLGGISSDEGHDIAVDSSGNAYVTGVTESINFPTVNEFQNDQPLMDGFVTKLNASGSALLYSTYLGGGDFDIINGLAVDVAGNAYVTGATGSINFPTVGAIQTDQPQHDAFVTKLNSAGSALVYSTYLGGSQPDSAQAIAVDSSSNAYVVGSTK